jgi:hypothetical protein
MVLFLAGLSVQGQTTEGLSNYTRLLLQKALQVKPVAAREVAMPQTAPSSNTVAAPTDRKEVLVRMWDEAISNGWVTAIRTQPTNTSLAKTNIPPADPAKTPAEKITLSTGLVLYLPFDEGKGNVARDAAGSGLDAQAGSNQPVLWTKGVLGQGISLGNSNLFRIPHTNSVSGFQKFSISFWINTTSAPSPEVVWVSKHAGGSTGEFLLAGMSPKSIRMTLVNSNKQRTNFDGPCPQWNDGKWHNVTGVFNGGSMALWLDNVHVVSGGFQGPLNSYESPIIVGDYDWKRLGYPSFLYTGVIDEVKIWNRVLSNEEVQQSYEEVKGQLK